jgi:hypothetical protein
MHGGAVSDQGRAAAGSMIRFLVTNYVFLFLEPAGAFSLLISIAIRAALLSPSICVSRAKADLPH